MAVTAPQISFEVRGLDELAKRLEAAGGRGQITLNELLRKIGQLFVPILRAMTPRVTGKLMRSTVAQVMRRGGQQVLEIRQAARTPEGEFYGQFVREGTQPHVIRPRRPDGVLRFVVNQQVVFTRRVQHPGTTPNPYHRRALRSADTAIQREMRRVGDRLARFIAGKGPP